MKRDTILIILGILCSQILLAQQTSSQLKDQGSIEIDGSTLDYIIKGEGKPCLVIGSSVYYPKTFSTKLYKQLKMYFVDLKWFAKGYKEEDLRNVNIQSIVEDVEQIRQKLGLEKPIIMGHSIHGTIAMEYVKRYAHEVSALVIIGSPTQWRNKTYEEKAAALWETASDERKAIQEKNWGKITEVDRLAGQEKAATDYHVASPQYWYNPNYDARWLWDGMTVHTELTEHLFTNVFAGYNMFEKSEQIPIPVFVALGIYDYVIPYTLWKSEYEAIPDFTMILFKKSGHTPQLEQRKLFTKKLIKWIQSKTSGK